MSTHVAIIGLRRALGGRSRYSSTALGLFDGQPGGVGSGERGGGPAGALVELVAADVPARIGRLDEREDLVGPRHGAPPELLPHRSIGASVPMSPEQRRYLRYWRRAAQE